MTVAAPSRLLAADPGPLPALPADRLVAAVQAAGLTGRGGAGFPTWRKLAAVAEGRRAVVVANAAEGEPESAKDAALVTLAPHLVLDGLQAVAAAVGAAEVFLCAKPGPVAAAARSALARRSDPRPVTVVEAEDGFVAGEESAVIARVGGGRSLPFDKPVPVARRGLRGRPTLVQNAETLAHVALIARHGPQWFRSQGSPGEPGSMLATVGGAVARPGVVEVPLGAPLGALLDLAGGAGPVQAVLVGGYHGTWVPYSADVPLSRTGLAPWGATPGAGAVRVLPPGVCGLRMTGRIAAYLAGASAGQCGPCRFGLPALAAGVAADRFGDMGVLAGLVTGRGACRHPDGTARMVASALTAFADEAARHRAGRCVEEE